MAKSWKRFSTGLWEASPEQAHANVHQKNNGKKLLLPFWNRLWLLGRLKPEDLRNSFALSLAPAIILPQSILPTIIRIGKSSKDWIKWFWFGKSLFFLVLFGYCERISALHLQNFSFHISIWACLASADFTWQCLQRTQLSEAGSLLNTLQMHLTALLAK